MQVVDVKLSKCYDSTASNTPRINEACVLLNQNLKTNRTYVFCRNRTNEMVLKLFSDACMDTSSEFERRIFKCFGQSLTIIYV